MLWPPCHSHPDEVDTIQAGTEEHPYPEPHELTTPVEGVVAKRTTFGTHWGLVYFKGEEAHTLRDLLKRQEDRDFYV